jgi:rhodanese-related sulfurtransferase
MTTIRAPLLAGVLLSLVVGSGCISIRRNETVVNSISVAQALRFMESDTTVVLLDVRTEQEWKSETGHLKDALLVPIQDLEARIKELVPFEKKTIIVYCRSGGRSQRAAKILAEKGYRVLNMEGGMLKWNAEQLPIVKEGGQ